MTEKLKTRLFYVLLFTAASATLLVNVMMYIPKGESTNNDSHQSSEHH